MTKTYRIGAIGYAHSHMIGNIRAFADCKGRVEFIAAADVKPKTPTEIDGPGTRIGDLHATAKEYGFKLYDDYEKLIDECEMDIALVCCENAYHPFVSEKLLRKGIHVVLEKPFAASMAGALRMARAAREGNAEIIINWPTTWTPSVRLAKQLCDEGRIGKIFKFAFRNSESLGPLGYGQKVTEAQKGGEWWHQHEVGGGALLDYCCYGACLSGWFTEEKPVGAYGLTANFDSHYGNAEDYANILIKYPQSVGLLEGSWTTVNSGVSNGPIIFGLKGTIVCTRDGKVEVYNTRHTSKPDEIIDPPPLPEGRDGLGKEVLHHLDTGEPLHETLALPLNLQAMSILDAGIRSAKSMKMEPVEDAFWCIGPDE